MTTVNPYFPKGIASEQNLLQGLITESIKIQGVEVYYIPRRDRKLDLFFGEDVLSKFDLAIPIEMYMDNPGWAGEQDIIQKFGLLVQERINFIVSKPRWHEVIPLAAPFMLNGGARPQEGDLIWDKVAKNLFEITYVDVESVYYQLSKTYQYKLQCQLFVYSSEQLDTGIAEIDKIEEEYGNDILNYQIDQENGDAITLENGESLIQNTPDEHNPFQFGKNAQIDEEAVDYNFNVNDPFGEMTK